MSDVKKHLLVVAGGTGGHVYPALAVADLLREEGVRVSWLGTRSGLESRVVPANNIEIHWLSVSGLRGKGIGSWLLAPFKLASAVFQSLRTLRNVRPDCVLGMGGFVSGPGGIAAWLSRVPLIVHEQNSIAGLTNRVLARIAKRVLTGFPDVVDLPHTAEWVGNPVRASIQPSSLRFESARENDLRVLILGGSQGAHSFNVYLPSLLAQTDQTLSVWHQSGRGRATEVEAVYQELGKSAKVTEFIEDMAAAYAWADVLVCRAGAMTIAECCAAGKPAMLVPFPFSAGDHQRFNAQMMVNAGAARMLDNADLQKPGNVQPFSELFADRERLLSMGQAARALHKADATEQVARACREFLYA